MYVIALVKRDHIHTTKPITIIGYYSSDDEDLVEDVRAARRIIGFDQAHQEARRVNETWNIEPDTHFVPLNA